MVKIKNPLLSFIAKGKLGSISYLRRRHENIAEITPVVPDQKTPAQLAWRHMYLKCAALWHTLSVAERAQWESLATPKHMTGFAYWQSQCLRPNPGIYLPLQGGTMSGDIDMDKHRVLKLPLPTDDQEAASKAYIDAEIDFHAAIANAHHTPPDIGEGHISIFPFNYSAINAGTWAFGVQGGWANYVFFNTSHDDADELDFQVYLAAGTYTLRILSNKGPSSGIISFDIDGAEVASLDLYNDPSVINEISSQAGIAVATAGLKTLTMRVDGKNASATFHYCIVYTIALWRTA